MDNAESVKYFSRVSAGAALFYLKEEIPSHNRPFNGTHCSAFLVGKRIASASMSIVIGRVSKNVS
jgi:hypothetical protein